MRYCRSRTATILSCLILLGVTAATAAAQEPVRRTVWDGVFTGEQVARGRAHFRENCVGCHDVQTEVDAPNLMAQEGFLEQWGEDYLVSLFDRLRNTMPARDPGSLSDDAYVELVAYLLDANGFPSGSEELTIDAMPSIRVESADGPGEVPDFSLAQVSGCLTRSDEGAWIVVSATAPVRTRDPSASTAEDLQALVGAPLGNETFELIYVFPEPGPLVGHKIEAKGFLLREPDPDQINVSSISSIAPVCR